MFSKDQDFQKLASEIQDCSLKDANTGRLHNLIMMTLQKAYQMGMHDERERLRRCLDPKATILDEGQTYRSGYEAGKLAEQNRFRDLGKKDPYRP